ncbi:MAG TPA: hypothetical protein VLA23_03225 [Candidatus Limnocylindrales bacterium]|nr:hypothetical protein [Candidatus Limnocylindrales bacterium]
MTLQHHRPDGAGGLEPRPVTQENWRRQLRSPRWGAALRGGKMPSLSNPEMAPTRTSVSLAFWLALGAATFVLLVVGYGTGFWS